MYFLEIIKQILKKYLDEFMGGRNIHWDHHFYRQDNIKSLNTSRCYKNKNENAILVCRYLIHDQQSER